MGDAAKGRLSPRLSGRRMAFSHGGGWVATLSGEQGEDPMADTSERLRAGEVLRGLDQQIDRKFEVAEVLMNVATMGVPG